MNEVKDILAELEKDKAKVSNEELKKLEEIESTVRQLNFSFINPALKKHGSVKRKSKSCTPAKPTKEMLEKKLEDTTNQIALVQKILSNIYELERNRFKELFSKQGENSRDILNTRTLMDRILERGRTIPLWIGKPDEEPPSLCGSIEAEADYLAKPGDLVTAFMGQKKKGKNWILAEVISYDPETDKYIVDDIFENNKAEQIISRDELIPLPSTRADPEINSDALFPEKAIVLALYPQTTCFYRAMIYKQPKKPQDPYMVLFEDGRYECNYAPPSPVDQCYILHDKESSEAYVVRRRSSVKRLHEQIDDTTEETESDED